MTTIVPPLYWLGHFLSRVLGHLLGRFRVHGRENIPETGGAIIAANHCSYLDPPIIGCGLKRPSYYMGKKELFNVPILSPIIRRVGCFPVDRERQDKNAVQFAIKVVREGHLMVLFPEGARSEDGRLQEAGIGAALIANRAGAPIVPTLVSGTFEAYPMGARFPRRSNITVRYGESIDSTMPNGKKANKVQLEELTERVMSAIARMQQEADGDGAR